MMKVSTEVAAALCALATDRPRSRRSTPRTHLGRGVALRALPRPSISHGRTIMATLVKRALRLAGPAIVLATALLAPHDGRAETFYYDAPLVFTRATYAPAPQATPISNFLFNGAEPNGSDEARFVSSEAGPASAFAKAARGPKGMEALAAAAGDATASARSFVRGVVNDPQNRPFVVWQVGFRAASSATVPGQAGWDVGICEWNGGYGSVITDGNDRVISHGGLGCGHRYFQSSASVQGTQSGGYRAEHTVIENGEVARKEVSDGSIVSTSQDSWLVGEIVVPNGAELVAWIHATTSAHLGSGATFITTPGKGEADVAAADPTSILTPHPDNPDVSITWHAEEAPPGPPFGGFGAEDLAALGIDPQPFLDMGLLESDPPAPELPCTGGTPLSDAKLTMSEGGAVDRSKLHLQGEIALLPLPLDPPFDPVARGARALLTDGSGNVLLDETVPGGAFDRATSTGWRHKEGGRSWVYTRPVGQGIHRLALKQVARTDDVYTFVVDARLDETPVPTAADLPLEATLVIDAPVAEDGQCGSAQFGGATGPACEAKKGPRLVCK
jgi:hypothetical protein